MASFSFWSSWNRPYKLLFQALLVLFLLTLGFALAASIWGHEWAVSWNVVRTYEPIEAPIAILQFLLSEIPIPVEHYITKEVFQGSPINLPAWLYPALSFLYFFFLSFFVAIITTLPRFWYYFGMTSTAFMLAALRLEQLMLWSQVENTALFLAILAYFSLSYYFHAINPHVHLYKRIGSFFVVSVLLLIVFGSFAEVSSPFTFMGSYGIVFPLLFALLFILAVSHDILSGFLYIITSGNTGYAQRSLFHFVVISLAYLGWVLLTYLNNTGHLELDMICLDATVLLSVSAVVGIWGFRNRSESVLSFLPFAPMGAFLYLILGIISFFTIGAMHLVVNTPMLEVIEDAIIFSHLGIGFMFFIYIIGNFAPLLGKNLNVYKVQYKPQNLPYFTASLGGIILMGVLVARSQLLPYFQGFAGYYNGLGDAYLIDKQDAVSEQYYKLAKTYDFRNAKSNYALGAMARQAGDDAFALKYFDDAMLKIPLESTYINIADIYERKGRFFDALFTLRKGLDEFPKSAAIKNNIGVLFSKTAVVDSALFYLDQKNRYSETSETNLLYALAHHRLMTDFDSLSDNFMQLSYLPMKNNTLVNLNMQQASLQALPIESINVDRQNLNAEAFAFWYEYGMSQAHSYEKDELATTLNDLANDSLNAQFQTELLLVEALYLYYHHQVGKAFENLETLAFQHASRAGYYYYLLGLWSLEQGAYHAARQYLEKSQEERYEYSSFPLALVLEASGDTAQAAAYWRLFQKEGAPAQKKLARLFLERNNFSHLMDEHASDSLIFLELSLNNTDRNAELIDRAESIEDELIKQKALLLIAQKAIKKQNYKGLEGLFAIIENKRLDEYLENQLKRLRLRYWLGTENNEKIAAFLEDSSAHTTLTGSAEWLHARARIALIQEGRDASQQYAHLATLNPFYAQGVVASAHFFRDEMDDVQQAYNMLLNGVKTNPYSATLQKAYIFQCLSMHLTTYAENSLATLKQLVSAAEYEEFLKVYVEKKDSIEQALNQWQ